MFYLTLIYKNEKVKKGRNMILVQNVLNK